MIAKRTGLICVLALALAAFGGTASASASNIFLEGEDFAAESYPAPFSSEWSGTYFETEGATESEPAITSCESESYFGEIAQKSPELTLNAAFDECSVLFNGGYLSAAVEMNSCQFVVTVNDMSIACDNAEDAIESKTYLFNTLLCTDKFGPQGPLSEVEVEDIAWGGESSLFYSGYIDGVEYVRSGGNCGETELGVHTDGVLRQKGVHLVETP